MAIVPIGKAVHNFLMIALLLSLPFIYTCEKFLVYSFALTVLIRPVYVPAV